MKKTLAMVAIAAALSSTNANAADFSVSPFMQHTITNNSKNNIDWGVGYGFKAEYKKFGLMVSRSSGRGEFWSLDYKPSNYIPETPGAPSVYIPGAPSSYTEGTYVPEITKTVTVKVNPAGNEVNSHGHGVRNDKWSEKEVTIVVTPSSSTPGTYVKEGEDTYIPETPGAPSSYEKESVSMVKKTKTVELYQAIATYTQPVAENMNVIVGGGLNFAKVGGTRGESFAGIAGAEVTTKVAKVPVNFGLMYNYNAKIRRLGLDLGDRLLAQVGTKIDF